LISAINPLTAGAVILATAATRTAATALRRYANRAKLIRTKIAQYAGDASSQANNVRQLVGVDAKRLRIGDFRVIFTETNDTIVVLDIGPRGGIYE
jgi:mRNA interferase RelE/StbE